jgi:nucleotide-binding universal stress UspA family protein
MSHKIIVGFDGSDRGHDALALARRLAEATGSELLVASAWAYEFYEMPPAVEGYQALMHQNAEAAAERAEQILGESGASAYRVIGATSPARALHELAEREEADLVVVGSTSRGAFGRVLPGSVGERLLHGAPCAVAVAPRGFASNGSLVPVGVGFDGSPEASAALASAAGIARALGGGLHAIAAWRHPSPANPLFAFTSYHEFVADLERGHRARLDEALASVPAGGRAQTALIEGDPETVLAQESEKLGLLVLGSRGYGPLRRALLGGVSGQLLQTAACAVIVVPRGVEHPFGAAPGMTSAAAGAR